MPIWTSQLNILTKYLMGTCLKEVNAITSKTTRVYKNEEREELDEQIRFFPNHVDSSRLTYQRKYGNQGLNDRERYKI